MVLPTGGEVSCRELSLPAGSRVGATIAGPSSQTEVFTASGTSVCGSSGTFDCTLAGTGPFRVLTRAYFDYNPNPFEADTWLTDYSSNSGCSTSVLASWGSALPGTGDRSGVLPECHLITTGSAGGYLWRLMQSSYWSSSVELYEAGGAYVASPGVV